MSRFLDRGRNALELAEPNLHQQRTVVIEDGARLSDDLPNLLKPVFSAKQ